jgi:putative sterol carrier protein
MADTAEFFHKFMPEKLASNPGLAPSVNAVFQFDITGAGVWTLDLTKASDNIHEGPAANPGCVITVAKSDWEAMLDKPAMAMQLFMMGKIKASNIGLAMQLQKILA